MERKKIQVNDHLRLKKPHPCGSFEWKVLRLGSDLKIECTGCGRAVTVPRSRIEKRIKEILPKG